MFDVSEKALEVIKRLSTERQESQSIRILMTVGGYRGAYLVMAFDEKKRNDQIITEKGVTFFIEKELFDRVKPISIDYVESTLGSGFKLKSELMKGSIFECDSIREHC